MTASHVAEVEALLVRLDEMRHRVVDMAKDNARHVASADIAEDLYGAEQALARAERLLRTARKSMETE